MSQNFDLGPTFDFMQSREQVLQNNQKLPFFDIKSRRRPKLII